MEETIRAQLYQWDMGAMRKTGIQHLAKDEFEAANESPYRKAIELTRDDWYGKKLPTVIR